MLTASGPIGLNDIMMELGLASTARSFASLWAMAITGSIPKNKSNEGGPYVLPNDWYGYTHGGCIIPVLTSVVKDEFSNTVTYNWNRGGYDYTGGSVTLQSSTDYGATWDNRTPVDVIEPNDTVAATIINDVGPSSPIWYRVLITDGVVCSVTSNVIQTYFDYDLPLGISFIGTEGHEDEWAISYGASGETLQLQFYVTVIDGTFSSVTFGPNPDSIVNGVLTMGTITPVSLTQSGSVILSNPAGAADDQYNSGYYIGIFTITPPDANIDVIMKIISRELSNPISFDTATFSNGITPSLEIFDFASYSNSSTGAGSCAVTGTATFYLYCSTISPTPGMGHIFYTDSEGVTPYNGNNEYWKCNSTNTSYQIGLSGQVMDSVACGSGGGSMTMTATEPIDGIGTIDITNAEVNENFELTLSLLSNDVDFESFILSGPITILPIDIIHPIRVGNGSAGPDGIATIEYTIDPPTAAVSIKVEMTSRESGFTLPPFIYIIQ